VPLYMGIHIVHGEATADGVAQADAADLKAQGAVGARYLRYWVSEAKGKIFCLVSTVCGSREHRTSRGSRAGCQRRFRSADRVVIRRRLAAGLVGPPLPVAPSARSPRCPARPAARCALSV
jgi:hypothetical protein